MVNNDLLSQYDWLPTLMEYLGEADRVPDGLPGRSFAPLLAGRSIAERKSIYVFDEYGPVRMIRSREWKLVWRYPAGPHELYNLAEDPDERDNLFSLPGHSERIRSLRRELDDWFASYVDPEIDGSKLPVSGTTPRRTTPSPTDTLGWNSYRATASAVPTPTTSMSLTCLPI